MRKSPIFITLLIFSCLNFQSSLSCSLYKITLQGKTFVGCNEDAWRTTPRIWFESKNAHRKYGAAFTGSRFDGGNGFAPQSGMNEVGLSFSRLASYTPKRKSKNGLKPIKNPTNLLKNILHTCRTVEEVQGIMAQYNRSIFLEDVFIYIDKSGKYLIVEPYTTQLGNEKAYVLSNFCPSFTTQKDALKLKRYRKGVELLQLKRDTTLRFLTALSDSMHVCRPKIGDGTLLTSIWDLSGDMVHLYFYHDYRQYRTFHLQDELKSGDHLFRIDRLFSQNDEFLRLKNYKTPKNSISIRVIMMVLTLLLFCLSIYFFVRFIVQLKVKRFLMLMLSMLAFAVGCYVFLLCTHQSIFYFAAPYKDRFSQLVSLSGYMPNVLGISMLPLLYFDFIYSKYKSWSRSDRMLFRLNNMIYLLMLGFFLYWELIFY